MTAPATPPDDYILGRTSEEYQRLRWQARLWEPITARVLDQVGIGPGMRCLDVGCGPGEVWEEFERVLYGVFEKTGRDPRFGQKLPLHVAAHGLSDRWLSPLQNPADLSSAVWSKSAGERSSPSSR